jgi:hypothetical protein
MSSKKIPTKLYTKSTRAPLLLWTYRQLLKYSIKFKLIDFISGEWIKYEIMLGFRRQKNSKNIEEIYSAYQHACKYKQMLQLAVNYEDLESQKYILRMAYGQTGPK